MKTDNTFVFISVLLLCLAGYLATQYQEAAARFVGLASLGFFVGAFIGGKSHAVRFGVSLVVTGGAFYLANRAGLVVAA